MRSTARKSVLNWVRRASVGVAAAALLVTSSAGVALAAPGDQSGSSQDQAAQDQAAQDQAAQDQAAQRKEAQQQAAQQRAAQQRAAEQRAAAAARAARAAQQAAEAAARGRASWTSHGQPSKMIIVRRTSVDSLTNGQVTRRIPRSTGVVTPTDLDRMVPSGWITNANGVTQVAAAIVLSPGVTLDVGGDTKTLQLFGGANPAAAASIYTGSGRLTVHGATVTSFDPTTGQPVAASAGRPFVQVSGGGRLDATDSTFTDLGTPATDPKDHPAVAFGTGSTGSLVRTTVQRSTGGVRLNESTGVRLEGLTISDSAADGLMLQGDQGTTLIGVRAERNGENGVRVSGPSSPRVITGISTTGNAQFGVAVVSQQAPQITGITTQADGAGGLQLSGDKAPVVSEFSAIDQPIGVFTHLGSSQVSLSGLRISGGNRGVMIEKTTTGLTLTGSTIERAQTGISAGGRQIQVEDVLVADSHSGLRVERGAEDVTARGVTVNGGQDGIVIVPGTSNVLVRDSVIDGPSGAGVRTSGPGAQLLGGRISNTPTGIDTQAGAIISGTEISAVNVGIRARSPELVTAKDMDVSAVTSGVIVEQGSLFTLTNSRVDALQAVSGPVQLQGLNNLSLPPLNVLGVIGIPLIVLALLLDQVQRFRQRRRGIVDRRPVPPGLRPVSG